PRFSALVAWTEARMEEWHIPGAAIAVVEGGELRHVAGLGVRRWGFPERVTPDTRFRVGSLSKMVAGALAAEEIAAGRLSLDAPAADVLGDVTLGTGSLADLTLLQLASHQSGLQTIGLPNRCDPDPALLADELRDLAPDWALWTPPGELYNYSNQGYSLLGLAVERSAASWSGGATYPELAARLFEQSGMTTATYDWVEAFAGNHATGHTMDLATGRPERYRTLDERACVASFPSGGLMASVTDIGHAVEMLVRGGEG
ncbi:MAG: serine hydrolase domain-containing protein, partial [Myxococcota bacterium]